MLKDELRTEAQYGPFMAALDERRRAFVEHLLDQRGSPNYAQAARSAGFSDAGEACKVRGFEMIRDGRVIAALHEESRRRFTILGWRGVLGVAAIADNPEHPDHFKACTQLADRFGYAAVTEHKVTVEKTDMTGRAMLDRIKALAAKHGMDPAKLLGGNTVADVSRGSPEITAEYSEVKPDEA